MVFGQKGYVMAPGDLGVYAAAYGFDEQIFSCPNGGCNGDSAC